MMRSSRTTSSDLSPSPPSGERVGVRGFLLWLLLFSSHAYAQACCAGTAALSPARLTPHEDAAIALEFRSGLQQGSLDSASVFHPNAPNSGELDLTQSLVGTLRVLRNAQLSLLVPVSESARWVPGLSDFGGGVGDISLAARYDFLLAGESARIPGLALLVGALFPTGRAPERALSPLGADATGQGVWQGSLGLGVEQSVGHVFLQSAALVQQRLPRTVGAVMQSFGATFSLSLAAGWAFDSGAAVAVTGNSLLSLPSRINGVLASDTLQSRTTLGLSGALPLTDTWRLQGSLATQLPFGRNELLSTTLTLMLLRTWT
jgi:hypothetical protein